MVYASTPSSSLPPKLELAQLLSWAWGGGSSTEVTDAARFPNCIAKEGEGPPPQLQGVQSMDLGVPSKDSKQTIT